MRTNNTYGLIFDQLVRFEEKADVRDSKAVKRIATAYMKLLFPHWTSLEEVNKEEFEMFCLNPAIYRRGIIKEQCHNIDPEFKTKMPEVYIQ
jgi:ATP-dependent Lon protease